MYIYFFFLLCSVEEIESWMARLKHRNIAANKGDTADKFTSISSKIDF